MVVPSLLSSVSRFITSAPFLLSRFPVGSSARMSLGLATTARAMATRCCWPPESCCGKCFSRCEMAIRFIASFTRCFRSAGGMRIYRSGSSMFSYTLSSSIRLKLWNTKPIMPLRRSVRSFSVNLDTSVPLRKYFPDVGLSNKPKMLSNVVFPQPEGPIMATNSPSLISIFTSANAQVSTSSVRKIFWRFSVLIIFLRF